MGTWGTGLYDDDDACDARDRFHELIGFGFGPDEATARVASEMKVGEDDDSVVWLVLADCWQRRGGLDDALRERALAILDGDSYRFPPEDRPARAAALQGLAARLARDPVLPPGAPSDPPVRRLTDDGPQWEGDLDLSPGRVLALRRADGPALLQVVPDAPGAVGGALVFDVMDWPGEGLPTRDDLQSLTRRRRAGPPGAAFVDRLEAAGVHLDPRHPLRRLYDAVHSDPERLPPVRYRPYGQLPRGRLADLGPGPDIDPLDAGWPATSIEWGETDTDPLN